ncbi:MAG: tRNA dihydrouridine synthase DusB [Clostridia bacterium]|nr:tRNA dihydrouridine synthase DusB [Clostridia bacterium]
MKIGSVTVGGRVFLAPMAGVTDYAYRLICEKYGADMVYSEMVSAKGLYYNDKKTEELLKGGHGAVYAVQIFGSEPDIIEEVAPRAASYGDILDINMGCPTPKIVNNGDGSALLKNPRLAGEIVKRAVKTAGKPVTVKMRIGWDKPGEGAEFAKVLEAAGASAIAVHGRTRAQFYSGSADWKEIAGIVSAVNIPVIGNGDVFSPEDAERMLNETGCEAVMIGRGAEGNPFIFRQIRQKLEEKEVSYFPEPRERIMQALEHVKLIVRFKGEERGIKEARKHLAWYIKGMKNNSGLKLQIFKATKYYEIEDLLSGFCNSLSK